jgi:hypothetical protein
MSCESAQSPLNYGLTFCLRPVTLEDVVDALAVILDDNPRFDADERYPEPRDILTRCSSLVDISETSTELRLAHFSVKEYLVSERIVTGRAGLFSVTPKCANVFIARTCLVYLLQFTSMERCFHTDFPLARYAATYWMSHASARLKDLLPLIKDLFQPNNPYFNWTVIFVAEHGFLWSSNMPYWEPIFIACSPLYYASLDGAKDMTVLLLDRGASINAQGEHYGNALQAASAHGHLEISQLLLYRGVDVNAQGGEYGNALQAASA